MIVQLPSPPKTTSKQLFSPPPVKTATTPGRGPTSIFGRARMYGAGPHCFDQLGLRRQGRRGQRLRRVRRRRRRPAARGRWRGVGYLTWTSALSTWRTSFYEPRLSGFGQTCVLRDPGIRIRAPFRVRHARDLDHSSAQSKQGKPAA